MQRHKDHKNSRLFLRNITGQKSMEQHLEYTDRIKLTSQNSIPNKSISKEPK